MKREDVVVGYVKTGDYDAVSDMIKYYSKYDCEFEVTVRSRSFSTKEKFHVLNGDTELYVFDYEKMEFKYFENGSWHLFHMTVNEAYALRAYVICLMRGESAPAFWPQVSRNISRRNNPLKNLSANCVIMVEDEL